jgi:hypothetical protein
VTNRQPTFARLGAFAGLVIVLCINAYPQEADRAAAPSRAGQIEAAREQKAKQLHEEKPSRIGRLAAKAKIIDRITGSASGPRLHLGGLATGSGMAAGPEYFRELARQEIVFHALALGSLKKFYAFETGLDFPRLADKRVFAGVSGRYENYPHIDFYGEGPNSSKAGRTAYAIEDTSFLGKAGVRPFEHLSIGLLGRYWLVNVGPSPDDRFARTEQVYSEAQAPGITRQTNYAIGGGFVQYDDLDRPGDPHNGGNYVAQFTLWSDRKLETGSFNRLDLDAQRYFSFFNERRVIALRWRSVFTEPGAGQVVPFYAQPTLGGPDDLRGFRAYRFYDRNSLVMNAEYRWEVANGVDAAIFADAGKVFHRWQDIDLSGLESSFGFGVRTNIKGRSFGRVDVGFSHEGFQVWLKFGNIF